MAMSSGNAERTVFGQFFSASGFVTSSLARPYFEAEKQVFINGKSSDGQWAGPKTSVIET
jgi:hypothetical protein